MNDKNNKLTKEKVEETINEVNKKLTDLGIDLNRFSEFIQKEAKPELREIWEEEIEKWKKDFKEQKLTFK